MNRMSDESAEVLKARHFRLHFQQAVLALILHGVRRMGSVEALVEAHSFLASHFHEIADSGLEGVRLDDAGSLWRQSIAEWESGVARLHLPLRALREALEFDAETVELLMMIGLLEEDIRFAAVFERFAGHGGPLRPALGLLAEVGGGMQDPAVWRRRLLRLRDAGLVVVGNAEAPASAWIPHVPLPVWEALRGEPPPASAGIEYLPPQGLSSLDDVVVSAELRATLNRLLPMLERGDTGAVVLRGSRHNGRRTTLKALARELGLGVVAAARDGEGGIDTHLGLMATLLNAMPVLAVDAAPGETVELPALESWRGPVGIALGREGGLAGPRMSNALMLTLPLPDRECRRRLWGAQTDGGDIPDLRMSSGHIRRAASAAAAYAALDGSDRVEAVHRCRAARTLGHESLDGLATRIAPLADAADVVFTADTAGEFTALMERCRNRERLGGAVGAALGAQLSCGVRALFRGPSGCGKTLAARKLAALLGRELYRVDLAAVINKYIGETEKKLARVLDCAEEVDAVLLFDEGDALMGKRTAVQNSTDRYSNLETNFLLQRLDEGFGGILVVTTNASDHIDIAFRRRMDAVIDFRLPDALERQTLWLLHLPRPHGVDDDYLSEASFRCTFAGGQIRNVVLHAALLAMQQQSVLGTAHLDAAIRREYRKSGAVCPLRGAPLKA
jgi:hypothetical protein